MSKKIIRGMPATALTLLAATSYGLLMPSPALAAHTCTHYVVVYCADWESHGHASAQECYDWEMEHCPYNSPSPQDPPAAATEENISSRAIGAARNGPSSAVAVPASAQPTAPARN